MLTNEIEHYMQQWNPPTDIQFLFTNYDIRTYFLNLAFCSEHFISIKHRILATFNINKKIQCL
jgi:hypothetical protein